MSQVEVPQSRAKAILTKNGVRIERVFYSGIHQGTSEGIMLTWDDWELLKDFVNQETPPPPKGSYAKCELTEDAVYESGHVAADGDRLTAG